MSAPAARSHQFLITMARANAGASSEVPLTAFPEAQRETGEVAVESEGAVEVKATATGGLRRMDLKESSDTLRSLARGSMQAAFRYQRRASESPALSLAWTRFPDAGVLAATAQDAVATTLVTSEGRSLTEIKLTVRNQAQPFLKVTLPAGATGPVRRSGGREGQARRRSGRQPRAAAPAMAHWLPPESLSGIVRLPPTRALLF